MDAHHTDAPQRLIASEIYGEVNILLSMNMMDQIEYLLIFKKLINIRQIIMAKYILVNLVVYNLLKL